MVGGLCWLIGWRDYLFIQVPTLMLAGAAGVWLFYVQHQFEDAYWQSTEDWELRRRRAARELLPRLPRCSSSSRATSGSTTCTI